MANTTLIQTIDHFNGILYWPHVVSYIVYLSQKILILIALCFHLCGCTCIKRPRDSVRAEDCTHGRSRDTQNDTSRRQYKLEEFTDHGRDTQNNTKYSVIQLFDLFNLLILFTSCCYGCFCCCSCCGSSDISKRFAKFVYRNRTRFDRWAVNIFLGKEERIVSRVNDYKDDIKDDLDVPHLYIHNRKLHHIDIRVLTLIVISFGLLTAGSAWNTFIFSITHVCTDDHPDIHCFAIPSDHSSNVNIPKERITNCSYWSDSSEVQFTCFQYAYNVQGALATFGGLLALFQLAITAITSGFLALTKCIILKNNKMNSKRKRLIKAIRRVISFAFGITEISIAIVVTAVLPQLDEDNVSTVKHFLHYHGGQLLIVIAVIATIPLLPLEEYVAETVSDCEMTQTQNVIDPGTGTTDESHSSLLNEV